MQTLTLTRRKAGRTGQTPTQKINDYYHFISGDIMLTDFVENLRSRYHNIWNCIVSLPGEEVIECHIEYCKENNIKISAGMAIHDLEKAITIFNGREKQRIRMKLLSKLKLQMSIATSLESSVLENRYNHLRDLLHKF